jgi:hypothetical protein
MVTPGWGEQRILCGNDGKKKQGAKATATTKAKTTADPSLRSG